VRALGAKVAIDDFGAGYTSFRNLQALKVDMVKIDGSFVKGMADNRDNQIFVRTLVDLAKNFNLSTVAEWVADPREADILRAFGVDYMQGFLFSKPEIREPWTN
jgi:EAL domain-containing protein (putative c-di-GMP-specific phosphodiesterase class I)